jgi:hypothetical protein
VAVDGTAPLPVLALPPRLGRTFRVSRGWRGTVELDAV